MEEGKPESEEDSGVPMPWPRTLSGASKPVEDLNARADAHAANLCFLVDASIQTRNRSFYAFPHSFDSR
jgi:hypothetical protein